MASLGLFPFTVRVGQAVRLYDFSYDPGGAGIESRHWDLGDGTTSPESSPTHRYATAGSYVVVLTVTTYDGRAGSMSQAVVVRG